MTTPPPAPQKLTLSQTLQVDLDAAEILLDTLRGLNRTDDGRPRSGRYATDATRDGEPSPYRRVRLAALAACTALCHGDRDRAEALLDAAYDCGETVAYTLSELRTQWRWDDEQARDQVITDTLHRLYQAAGDRNEVLETLDELINTSGLRWPCPHCRWPNPASETRCEDCGRPREKGNEVPQP